MQRAVTEIREEPLYLDRLDQLSASLKKNVARLSKILRGMNG
jgi:hypothetical protein